MAVKLLNASTKLSGRNTLYFTCHTVLGNGAETVPLKVDFNLGNQKFPAGAKSGE
jgi:hypothetical protein